jgi:putative PEP-CTERM system histidine kinase
MYLVPATLAFAACVTMQPSPDTGLVFSEPGGIFRLLLHVLIISGAVICLVNLMNTLQASIGTMRWRVKYTVLALGVFCTARIFASGQEALHGSPDPALSSLICFVFVATCALIFLSLRRGSLGSVDLYVSHRMLVQSITLLLACVVVLAIGFLVFKTSGLEDKAAHQARALILLAGGIVTVVLLMSDRIRQSISQFVSAHFRRPRYDYQRVWNSFTQQTASLRDEPVFSRAAVHVVSETFEALSVTLWLIDVENRKCTLGGSTVLDRATSEESALNRHQILELSGLMTEQVDPIALDEIDAEWARRLIQANPKPFTKARSVCMPLHAGEQWLGLLVVGDRVNFAPFGAEDQTLLKTIGDYIAAQLHQFRLSRQLLAAREFETFQSMSTFFVHDLKNLASTLSLMLKNLIRHFEDPEFREDAVQSISETVDKINGLVDRLSAVRGKHTIQTRATELNILLRRVVSNLEPAVSQPTRVALGEIPPVALDEVEIEKVVTNLLLNASDASRDTDTIFLQTKVDREYVVLSVRDEGSGMSPEFTEKYLFKPFHSSKKNGLGIGLFHCKRIVEAHGGTILVESELGKGSEFRVLLPHSEVVTDHE